MSTSVKQDSFSEPENDAVRAVLDWLSQAPGLPGRLNFQHLPGRSALDLRPRTGERVLERFLDGGCRVRLPLELRYRSAPTADEERLRAGEVLEGLARWAESDPAGPDLGVGRRYELFRPTGHAVLEARYESGYEDRLLPCELTYYTAPPRRF